MQVVSRLAVFLFSLSLAIGCGGDYDAAYVDSTWTPAEGEGAEGEAAAEPERQGGERVDPGVADLEPDDRTPLVDPEPEPEPDKTVPDEPKPDKDKEPKPKPYDPDWTDNDDPTVQGCLEMFPAICNKVTDCSDELPALALFGGFCAPLFDGISPILEMGCGQLADLLSGAGGDLGGLGALGGAGLQQIMAKLLKGCIENFTCDLDFIIKLGEKLAAVVQLFTGGGQDFTAALPQLMELAQMCGGIGNLLPF